MTDKVTIAVDVMGGDQAPRVVLEGIEAALEADNALSVVLCGEASVVKSFASMTKRARACECSEVIDMDEHPAQAVRTKKDSSIVVGCRLVKEGAAQGFFSAGSTGACLTAATLGLGRIKAVARPALATIIPSPIHPVVLCDVGANADCKPEYLLQFAQMASLYAQEMLGIAHPSVALLNIGEEKTKGSLFAQKTYDLLQERLPQFAGNAEGSDILAATYDVIVTDGFTGNICLKTIEGTSKVLFSTIKDILMANLLTKVAALTIRGGLRRFRIKVSPDTYGGAPLLGVQGAVFVGHGSSGAQAIKNGILTTAGSVRAGLIPKIAQVVGGGDSGDV